MTDRNVIEVLEGALVDARSGRLAAVIIVGTDADQSNVAIAYADNDLTTGLRVAMTMAAWDLNIAAPAGSYDESGLPFQPLEWRPIPKPE